MFIVVIGMDADTVPFGAGRSFDVPYLLVSIQFGIILSHTIFVVVVF
jgi:hypothetical protein